MNANIRRASASDKNIFIDFAIELSKFNRVNHRKECKYDNYDFVVDAIRRKAEKIFVNRDDNTLILIAEIDNKPVGYARGRIYKEDITADNGTGKIGFIDELYLKDAARGFGLGKKLLNQTITWMKDKGINRIKLHAYSWNDNAKRLYKKNGFKEYAVSYEKFI